jgi:AAA domain
MRANQGPDLPTILQQHNRWGTWKLCANQLGKPTKVPRGSTNSDAWKQSFNSVATTKRSAKGGIGFAFTGGVRTDSAKLFAWDLDGCRDPVSGKVRKWARDVVDVCKGSYTEITPSGTGLRVWFLARTWPERFARLRIKVDEKRAANVPDEKPVEAQLFGDGSASYVTVTGDHWDGSGDDIELLDDFDALTAMFPQLVATDDDVDLTTLPVGAGTIPTADEIEARVRNSPRGPELLAGEWEAALEGTQGGFSASDAWWRLVQLVLRAARGDGKATVDFLLNATPWGAGLIENSRSNDKYSSPEWVARDVARVAGKTDAVRVGSASAFDDGFVDTTPAVADEPAPKKKSLLTQLAAFAAKQGAQQFLVKGLLPRVGLAQWFGDAASGKTPFAMSLALHVAAKRETWFGRKIARHGAVVYMVGEDAIGLANRARAECQVMGITAIDKLQFYFTERPGELTNKDDAAEWVTAIREAVGNDVALLVIDTQVRNFGPGDESSTEDMAAFLNNCALVANALRCCLALVHHKGHMDKTRARGSSAQIGALDACFEVVKLERVGKPHRVEARCTKHKNWARPDDQIGELIPVTIGRDEDGEPVTAITLRHDTAAAPEADTVFDDTQRAVLLGIKALEGVAIAEREMADWCGVGRTALRTAVKALQASNSIVVHKQGGRGKTVYLLRNETLADGLEMLD